MSVARRANSIRRAGRAGKFTFCLRVQERFDLDAASVARGIAPQERDHLFQGDASRLHRSALAHARELTKSLALVAARGRQLETVRVHQCMLVLVPEHYHLSRCRLGRARINARAARPMVRSGKGMTKVRSASAGVD